MSAYEIEIVAVPEHWLACLGERSPVAELEEHLQRLKESFVDAGMTPAGAPQARFYGDVPDGDAVCEVCLPLRPDEKGWTPDTIGDATVTIVPAHHAMATTHAGPRSGIAAAHEAVKRELEMLGYTQAGPASETYVDTGAPPGADTAGTRVTVVAYPYAR